MSKIAVIGDATSVLGFKPLGIDAYRVVDPGDVVELWPTVISLDYAVIMMTETVFEAARDLVEDLESRVTPAILAIPSTKGSSGVGKEYITALMEKAVGTSMKGKGL